MLLVLLVLASAMARGQVEFEEVRVHQHQPVRLSAQQLQPQLEIWLYPDASNGFNLQLKVRNYQLEAPELAGDAPPQLAEGHAHLMINGKKRIRIYGEWIHLDKSLFREGINQLTVTLNSHNHFTWVAGKQPLLATIFVDPAKTPPVQHRFSSSPLDATAVIREPGDPS